MTNLLSTVSASAVVIAIVTQKGGAAKTTLCCDLAVCAMQAGWHVAIVDIDAQGSAAAWGQRRGGRPPIVIETSPVDLDRTLAELRDRGFDLILIDTPGTVGAKVDPALAACHIALVPCAPTISDLAAALPTVRALHRFAKPFNYVLTKCPTGERRITEAQALLDRLAARAGEPLHYRVDFQDASALGLGVIEHNRSGLAAREIRILWDWLAAKLDQRGEDQR